MNKNCDCKCGDTDKVVYRCAICNKGHDTIEERIACETKCLKERNEAEEKREQIILEREKNVRMQEIRETYDRYLYMLEEYVCDYGIDDNYINMITIEFGEDEDDELNCDECVDGNCALCMINMLRKMDMSI